MNPNGYPYIPVGGNSSYLWPYMTGAASGTPGLAQGMQYVMVPPQIQHQQSLELYYLQQQQAMLQQLAFQQIPVPTVTSLLQQHQLALQQANCSTADKHKDDSFTISKQPIIYESNEDNNKKDSSNKTDEVASLPNIDQSKKSSELELSTKSNVEDMFRSDSSPVDDLKTTRPSSMPSTFNEVLPKNKRVANEDIQLYDDDLNVGSKKIRYSSTSEDTPSQPDVKSPVRIQVANTTTGSETDEDIDHQARLTPPSTTNQHPSSTCLSESTSVSGSTSTKTDVHIHSETDKQEISATESDVTKINDTMDNTGENADDKDTSVEIKTTTSSDSVATSSICEMSHHVSGTSSEALIATSGYNTFSSTSAADLSHPSLQIPASLATSTHLAYSYYPGSVQLATAPYSFPQVPSLGYPLGGGYPGLQYASNYSPYMMASQGLPLASQGLPLASQGLPLTSQGLHYSPSLYPQSAAIGLTQEQLSILYAHNSRYSM